MGTVLQAMPSQCMLNPWPTAQTSSGAIAATSLSEVVPGLGTMRHAGGSHAGVGLAPIMDDRMGAPACGEARALFQPTSASTDRAPPKQAHNTTFCPFMISTS